MPVNLTFESQDAVPEVLRDYAVEKDGKYVFEAETSDEVANLKKTTQKERDARTKYERELKRLEKFKSLADADEDEIEQFLEGWSKRGEKGKPGTDPETANQGKLYEKQIKKREDEIAALKGDTEKLRQELREFQLWTPLRETAIKNGVNAEDWDLVRLDLANQARFGFDDDGKVVVMEDGVPSSVTPERFFKEVYSDQRPKFYKATGAGGSGAQSGTKSGNSTRTISRAAWQKMSPQESTAFFKSGGKVID